MDEKRDEEKLLRRDEPDMYIRTLASTWGHLDLIRNWMQHHMHEQDRAKVTELVLFPAAMYGQLEILQYAIGFGEFADSSLASIGLAGGRGCLRHRCMGSGWLGEYTGLYKSRYM